MDITMPFGILYNKLIPFDPEKTGKTILIQEARWRSSKNNEFLGDLSSVPLVTVLRKIITNLRILMPPWHGVRYSPSVYEKEKMLPTLQPRQLLFKTFFRPLPRPDFKRKLVTLFTQSVKKTLNRGTVGTTSRL